MKSGRAAKWTARIFKWEELSENEGCSKFADWEDFRDEFKKEFTPAHTDSLAINRLKSTAYYQKSRSLDDYIDEFQDLITESGYTDPKTIMVKFRRGLNPQIQNAVATMASGRPSDMNPTRWYAHSGREQSHQQGLPILLPLTDGRCQPVSQHPPSPCCPLLTKHPPRSNDR